MKIQKLYNNSIELILDDKHIYWTNGVRIKDSSTGTVKIIDKSAPMMGWAIKLMALYLIDILDKGNVISEETILQAKKEYRKASKKAADIGSAIHEWIENWIKGNKPEIPDDEKIANGITAFLKWQSGKMKFNKKDSERLVLSKKYWYAGTLDAIATIGKDKVVIDFKSSNDIYNEHRYQLASYWYAYEEEFGETLGYGLIVRFDKETGNFDPDKNILKISRKEYEKDFKAFLGALAIRKREEELKLL